MEHGTGPVTEAAASSGRPSRARPSARPAAPAPPAVLAAIGLAACDFAAALPALYCYHVPGAAAELAGVALGSTTVASLAAAVFRLGAAASYGVSTVGFVIAMLAADGPHPAAFADQLVHGPTRVLTEALPLSGSRSTLAALAVLTWVCGAAASEWYFRSSATALVLPVGLYALSYAAASSAPTRDRIAGPVLIPLLALCAVLRNQATGGVVDDADTGRGGWRSWPYRSLAPGVGLAAGVAVVLASIAPVVPALNARPSGVHLGPPTSVPLIVDPVDSMALLRDGQPGPPAMPELSVSFSSPTPGYLAMAYLDLYDGGQWRFSATFQPTGGRVPGPPLIVGPRTSRRIVQRVRLTGPLPVPLMPALDRPLSVSGLAAAADPVSGMLLPQSRVRKLEYSVVSTGPPMVLEDVPQADGIDATRAVPADLGLPPGSEPDVATTIRFLSALDGGARPAPTVAFLQTVLSVLHTGDKRIDAARPPVGGRGSAGVLEGTSLSEVINAVTVTRAATPEQFATFYASVARFLGVPARLVTGFRAGPAGGTLAAGSYSVTNRQAWTWVEIPVSGLGWVVCDPTPDSATGPGSLPPESAAAPSTTLPVRQANVLPRRGLTGGHPLAPRVPVLLPHGHPLPAWVYAGAGLAGAVVVLGLAGPGQAALRRSRRRRLRRSSQPDELAVGAWLELLDALYRAGLRAAPGATAGEVAEEVGHHFGPELVRPASAVATAADRAVFSISTEMPLDLARDAWDTASGLRRQLLAGLDARQRIRASVLVGSAPGRPTGDRP